jgi:hypothetical protein
MLPIALAAALLATAAQEGGAMPDPELRKELEAVWAGLRAALAEYRLDDVAKYVEVPKDAPKPDRAQARQFAESLPDLATARFLRLDRDGDRAGYYARTEVGKPGTTVAVIRFRKAGSGWQLVPGPHTISSYSTDEALDEAKVRALLEKEPTLALRPKDGDEAPPAPPAPKGEAPDARPEAEIRKELEGIWRKVRAAFAAGKPGDAADVLLWVDGATEPGPDEAKAAAKAMPDLARGRFIKLAWSAGKPHLAGYIAEVDLGNAKKTTVAFITFVRKDGAWKLAPGPRTLELIVLPPTGQAALRTLVDTDPRFGL